MWTLVFNNLAEVIFGAVVISLFVIRPIIGRILDHRKDMRLLTLQEKALEKGYDPARLVHVEKDETKDAYKAAYELADRIAEEDDVDEEESPMYIQGYQRVNK